MTTTDQTIDDFLSARSGTVAKLFRSGELVAVAVSKDFGEGVRIAVSDYHAEGLDVVEQFIAESEARVEVLGHDADVVFSTDEFDQDEATDDEVESWYERITDWLEAQPAGTVIFEGRTDTESADFSVGVKLSDGMWNSTGCDFIPADEVPAELAGYEIELLPSRIF